jgi:tripartite-type tricarboxylate transporter receptor subunit TctC
MAGVELVHVPYKGTLAALTDVMGGRTEVMFVSPGVALPFVKDRRLRVLGVTGPQRLSALPDAPPIHEAGLPGYEFTSWHGMWFPAGVPGEIVRRMHAEVVKALGVPEVRKYFSDNFLFPVGSAPEEFAEFVKRDIDLQVSIVKKIGLEPE